MFVTHRFLPLLAGAALFGGAACAAPRVAPTAERCGVVAPDYKPHESPRALSERAAFQGGAKLRSLVGTPCRPAVRTFEA